MQPLLLSGCCQSQLLACQQKEKGARSHAVLPFSLPFLIVFAQRIREEATSIHTTAGVLVAVMSERHAVAWPLSTMLLVQAQS